MFTTLCQSFVGRPRIALLGIVLAIFLAVSLGSSAFGQDSPSKVSGQVLPSAAIAEGDSTRTPLVLTLQDALARAKANDPQFRAARTELGIAHQDTVQSRAQLLPNVNYNMQYVYTQGNGTATGRFLANNGVHEYIAQGNVHQALSPGMFAEYRKTAAAEALARAKAEIATRGLVVTVVQAYYGYVVAQRKYATAQKAASEADHFFGISQKLQNGGEVARSDVIKAQIQNNQTQRDLQDALLAMNKTRLDLAVLLFPNFDDPLRQAMRREVELLFDSIVHEDRNVVDLLTADYTFVNERLAKHYGIPNIYGSQFRRVTLGPDMDVRKGVTGKGAFLVTTAKPERTSPVTRGKWVMTNILGMSPPDPPPNVPPLPPRMTDAAGNSKEPSMRQKMLDHRVRSDCVQCHSMMDPIGFSLENFDGIGLWRTHDEGTPVDPSAQVFDGTKIDSPAALRSWLLAYSSQFVEVVAEKLLTYALGRGLERYDRPIVNEIAAKLPSRDYKFSNLVVEIVNSLPFEMKRASEAGQVAAMIGGISK